MAFVLEIATLLASHDKASVALLGETVADALQNVIRDASNVQPLLLSRTIFYLFHLINASQGLQDQSIVKTPVVLHAISGFEQPILEHVAEATLRGLALCTRDRSQLRKEILNTPDFWLILKNFHTLPRASSAVFDILEDVVASKSVAVTSDNYVATISILDNFATAASIGAAAEQQGSKKIAPQSRERRGQRQSESNVPKPPSAQDKDIVLRGYRAVILISKLIEKVPELIKNSHLDHKEAWMTYWTPIFQKLQVQCQNPCRKIRRQACSSLQNALLSPELMPSTNEEWAIIFQTVLFGLIQRLLKPEIYQLDPAGMNETRLQAANLLCRTFLHHLPTLAQRDDLLDLWLKILDVMDRLKNSGQGDNLEEAVPEGLKNILLVMAGSEVLTPPEKGQEPSILWVETQKRVDRFLPGLMDELFSRELPQDEQPARPPSKPETEGVRANDIQGSTEQRNEEMGQPPSVEVSRDDVD